uniref:Uncharacterized protein n=1 Tax=Arundo donax TaxID=35708 RepID=A0A0A9C2N3_ARUDO
MATPNPGWKTPGQRTENGPSTRTQAGFFPSHWDTLVSPRYMAGTTSSAVRTRIPN